MDEPAIYWHVGLCPNHAFVLGRISVREPSKLSLILCQVDRERPGVEADFVRPLWHYVGREDSFKSGRNISLHWTPNTNDSQGNRFCICERPSRCKADHERCV